MGGFRYLKEEWAAWRATVWDGGLMADPAIIADLLERPESLGLHYLAGICGIGPYTDCSTRLRPGGDGKAAARRRERACRRGWAAWDGLLMVLACFLGVAGGVRLRFPRRASRKRRRAMALPSTRVEEAESNDCSPLDAR